MSTWNRCNLSIAVPTYDTSQSSCVFTRLEQAAPSPCQEPVNYNCPMTTTSIPTTTLQVITLKQCPAFCDPSCSCADDTQVLLDAEGEFDATLKLGTHGNESAADAILSTWNRCNLSIAVPTYDTSQSSCVFTRLEQAAPSPCQEPVNYNCPVLM
ncbi:hypothetical protein B566_EDAN007112, partial [Ephemera danica]